MVPVSQDLNDFVDFAATCRERYVAQSMGCAVSKRERSLIIGQIRRKLSTAFIRAISLCTLSRVANIGPGSRACAKRREWALREDDRMRLERRAHWTAHVNGGRRAVGGINFFPVQNT